jgi:hypothetical protein
MFIQHYNQKNISSTKVLSRNSADRTIKAAFIVFHLLRVRLAFEMAANVKESLAALLAFLDLPGLVEELETKPPAFEVYMKRSKEDWKDYCGAKGGDIFNHLKSFQEHPPATIESTEEVNTRLEKLEEYTLKKEERIQKLRGYIFYTFLEINGQMIKGCVTAVTKNLFATYAHRNHNDIEEGAYVTIHSELNRSVHQVKVIKVDKRADYILMKSDVDVCQDKPVLGVPYEGEDYLQFGLSAIQHENTPISVSKGVFVCTNYDDQGHYLGSAGANPGDSGGGCFSERTHTLFGINVGADTIAIHGETTLFEMGSRHASRAHIVPNAFFLDYRL